MKEYTSYKKQLIPAIVDEACRMFLLHGIRAVKMDDISCTLHISKRTLYEIYSNKEALLQAVVRKIMNERRDKILAFMESSDNVMDILIEVLRLQVEAAAKNNPAFYRELRKYPQADQLLKDHFEAQKAYSMEFFAKGVSEGYFISGVDFTLITVILRDIVDNVLTSEKYKDITYQQLLRNYLYVTIRGFCTTKGIDKLDEFYRQEIVNM